MTGYVNPDVLVSTAWVAEHFADVGVRIVEADEEVHFYDSGHIPGAVKVDWHTDLTDPRVRDYVDAPGFARLMARLGIANDTTVVFYGDNSNWWACYAYWVFRLYGHTKLKIMDGGRAKWIGEGRPLVKEIPAPDTASYTVIERHPEIRAYRSEVLAHIGSPSPRHLVVRLPAGHVLVDVRSPEEFSGRLLHMVEYPQEGALRGGHIPGAVNIPWEEAVREDGTFRSAEEIRAVYESQGVTPDKDIVTYCRIGERSALTWFVLHELMGYRRVRNYDGSWTEWGNGVGLPIANPSAVGAAVSQPEQGSGTNR
jgi:thiosulfate/3-mercaptopyruvate sulfurtransferase